MRISLEEARQIVADHWKIHGWETLPLEQCVGRILAEDVTASLSQPPFRRSAMDGYAVRKADVLHCLKAGTPLKVIGEIDAGDPGEYHMDPLEAVRIMTGAKVPDEADMVIPQELSDLGKTRVIFRSVPLFDNIAPIGEDFKEGELIAGKGQRVDACLLACGAASGIMELKVFKSPRIAVISTGDELCQPGKPLKPGKIYDSNLAYLSCRLKQFHCQLSASEYVKDDVAAIARAVGKAVDGADMVITTGGVSVGKKDFLEQAVVTGLGGTVLFHGIAVKPGMPTMFSLVSEKPILSLSGNPYSAGAVFEWLFPFWPRFFTEGSLVQDFKKKRPCPRIVRGYFDGFSVKAAAKQQNGVTWSGIGTNCLALLPAGDEVLPAGTKVPLLLM